MVKVTILFGRPNDEEAFQWFESQQDLDMALRTPEVRATIEDLVTFASGGVTVVTSVVHEELMVMTPVR